MTRPAERDRSSGHRIDPTTAPRFMDIVTFIRAPIVEDLTDFDIAFGGVVSLPRGHIASLPGGCTC